MLLPCKPTLTMRLAKVGSFSDKRFMYLHWLCHEANKEKAYRETGAFSDFQSFYGD